MKLAACAALALLIGGPALADPPGDFQPNHDADGTWGSRESLQGPQPRLVACEQLMERAFYLSDPANPDRAADARREMELARDAFHEGDEFSCRRHAIHALEDRT